MKLTYLQHGKNGGVCYRTTAHEYLETEGLTAEELFCRIPIVPPAQYGKLHFPVKDCAPYLCEGPAEVEIVATKDNYNFFSGRMVQFTAPSDERLCAYIYEEKLEDATFTRMTGSIRGDYIRVYHGSESYILVGEAPVRLRGITRVDDKAIAGSPVSGRDLICRVKQGCDFTTFAEKFRTSFVDYEYSGQARVRIDYVPDERLNDWVDNGIVELFVHTHRKRTVLSAKVYATAEDILIAARFFTPAEFKEMVGIVNAMNVEANAATKAFMERKKA